MQHSKIKTFTTIQICSMGGVYDDTSGKMAEYTS